MEEINILVTLDKSYIKPLKVMLLSLKATNVDCRFSIWLLHDSIPEAEINHLRGFTDKLDYDFHPLKIDATYWQTAPTLKQYPTEMYYRLLCTEYLPADLERIIYLDPDTLILNPIEALWSIDLKGNMIAAASHLGLTGINQTINNVRLRTKSEYFNSGVMLIDLNKMRAKVNKSDILDLIKDHAKELVLPDQDILNYLYGNQILSIPEEIWNFDTRANIVHFAKSRGQVDTNWVIANTSILHFCGRPKPWDKHSINRFTILYQHYQRILELNYN